MTNNTTAERHSLIEVAYKDLNDSQKAILRVGFLEMFDYKSFDSFYKKLSGETKFWKNEKLDIN